MGRKYSFLLSVLLEVLGFILILVPGIIVKFFYILMMPFPGYLFSLFRLLFVRRLGIEIGRNVFIGHNVNIKGFDQLSIGNNVSLHENCYVDARGGLSIGEDVSVAHGCSLITANHSFVDPVIPIKYNVEIFEPIVINSDVWIGAKATILPGVSLQSRTVIASNAVLTRGDYKSGLYGGVPARLIKRI